MIDKPQANMTPIIYAHRVHELQTICRANGYALALHGSMERDLDAIAVPWTDDPAEPEELVRMIASRMGLTPTSNWPTLRPHGRKVWSLLLGEVGFVDLSVMPPTTY